MSESSADLMRKIAAAGYDSRVFAAAHLASSCSCGKPECLFRPGYLVGFRDHIGRLHHAVSQAQYLFEFREAETLDWNSVTYQLQMAASIGDLSADTSAVDQTASYMWCKPAIEYEDRHSRLASSYAAGLIIFNFLWAAYESAIKVGALKDFYPKQHTAFRGRELLRLHDVEAEQLGCLAAVMNHASRLTLHVGDLGDAETRLSAFDSRSAAYGAELVRLFRNHLAHGDDVPPTPDQSHEMCRAIRFYALSRVLLFLIQLIAHQALRDSESAYDEEFRHEDDKEPLTFGALMLSLHLHGCEI